MIPPYGLIVDCEDRHRRIADAAYYRYSLRGCESGHELEDWLCAEQAVDAELLSGGIVPLKATYFAG
jgi:hypothetical protein